MRYEIQGKIEGRDSRNRSKRKTPHDAPAPCRKLLPIEGKILAVNASALLCRDCKCEDRALHLSPCCLDGFSGFLRQSVCEFLFAFRNSLRHPAQDALSFECGQATRRSESFYSRCNGCFSMLARALEHPADHSAIVRSPHFDKIAILNPSAVYEETMRCYRGYRHLRHKTSYLRCDARRRIISAARACVRSLFAVPCLHFNDNSLPAPEA